MGRPRKAGPREPNGRISRASKATYWQRQRDELETRSLDHRLGTPLGVLYRASKITSAHMEAGTWFADLRNAADAALGIPPRCPTAQDLAALRGAVNTIETEEQQRAKRRAVEAYDNIVMRLGQNSRMLAALELVCIYERRPDTHEQLLLLIAGLDALNRLRSSRRAA